MPPHFCMTRGLNPKPTNLSVIRKTVYFFVVENSNYKFILLGVLSSIVYVKIKEIDIKMWTNKMIETKRKDEMMRQVIEIFTYEIITHIVLELKYVFFINVYGREISRVCTEAFKNIMKKKTISTEECQNGVIQNNFHIGSLGFAKLLSLGILNILSNMIGISILLLRFKKNFDFVFMLCISVAVALCSVIHLAMISAEIHYKKISNTNLGKEKKVIYDVIMNFENIKASGTEEKEILRYEQSIRTFQKGISLYRFIYSTSRVLNKVLFSIIRFLVFLLYIYTTKTDICDKIAVLNSLLLLVEKETTRMGKVYNNFRRYLLDSHFIHQYLEVERLDKKMYNLNESIIKIELKGISIRNNDAYLIQNFNLTINPGEKIAVFGRNGIGKSCLINTLLSFREYEGIIHINGIDLHDIDEGSYKSCIGYVPQKIILFNDTVYFNLTYGTINKTWADVIKVCTQIGLHGNIIKRSQGYNSQVGEGGRFLSGGEQQKIMIARAMLRNPDVLMMDEPFSNLDDKSYRTMMYLMREMKDKIFIVILHHTKYLECFDRFLYFNEYGIRECGDVNEIIHLMEDD